MGGDRTVEVVSANTGCDLAKELPPSLVHKRRGIAGSVLQRARRMPAVDPVHLLHDPAEHGESEFCMMPLRADSPKASGCLHQFRRSHFLAKEPAVPDENNAMAGADRHRTANGIRASTAAWSTSFNHWAIATAGVSREGSGLEIRVTSASVFRMSQKRRLARSTSVRKIVSSETNRSGPRVLSNTTVPRGETNKQSGRETRTDFSFRTRIKNALNGIARRSRRSRSSVRFMPAIPGQWQSQGQPGRRTILPHSRRVCVFAS